MRHCSRSFCLHIGAQVRSRKQAKSRKFGKDIVTGQLKNVWALCRKTIGDWELPRASKSRLIMSSWSSE